MRRSNFKGAERMGYLIVTQAMHANRMLCYLNMLWQGIDNEIAEVRVNGRSPGFVAASCSVQVA